MIIIDLTIDEVSNIIYLIKHSCVKGYIMRKRAICIVIALTMIAILSASCVACDGVVTKLTAFDYETRLNEIGYTATAVQGVGEVLWTVKATKTKYGENKNVITDILIVEVARYESVGRAETVAEFAINKGKAVYRRGDVVIIASDTEALNDALGR